MASHSRTRPADQRAPAQHAPVQRALGQSTSAPMGDLDLYPWVHRLTKLKPRFG
jgi:hypothetical protein